MGTWDSSLSEIWKRLEEVYGNKDLNIITIKNNLDRLVPKATSDYKKIMEIYEAVEAAQTQLQNLGAIDALKEDFALLNKIILKLPPADQKQYSLYITSASVESSTESRWEKFWSWLKQLHKSAVQSSLMYMCDRTAQSKPSGGAI